MAETEEIQETEEIEKTEKKAEENKEEQFKLFDIYDVSGIVIVDPALRPYINLEPKLLLKSYGRNLEKFGKTKQKYGDCSQDAEYYREKNKKKSYSGFG